MKIIGIKYKGDKNTEIRIEYVLDFLNNHPLNSNIKFEKFNPANAYSITMGYGLDTENFQIPCQTYVFSANRRIYPHANIYTFEKFELSSVEKNQKPTQAFLHGNTFGFDWLEMIFYHLSRHEEYYCRDEDKDEWDIMNEGEQLLVKNHLHLQPQIDILITALLEILGDSVRQQTGLVITHDIDHHKKFYSIKDGLKSTAKTLFKSKNLQKTQQSFIKYLKRSDSDPYDNFDSLFVKGEATEKTVFLLVGGNHNYDSPEQKSDEKLLEIIDIARHKGYNIGIHPSYSCWTDARLFNREMEILSNIMGSRTSKSRQHYLHFHFCKTISVLQENEIKEDYSLGFNRYVGFRCGTGFPFRLYDFDNHCVSDIIEKPMILMDGPLLTSNNYNKNKILDFLDGFINQNQFNTRITINFHNSSFYNSEENGLDLNEIYRHLLSSFNISA
ncbi:MAG: hypothetical protein R2766_05035 [Saprospiraceae bacterium]